MAIQIAIGTSERARCFELDGDSPVFTFGRDKSCTLCLDPLDVGISRIAGSISTDGGTWWVTNLSETRPLHIVESTGIAVPLPVQRDHWPEGRRAIDVPEMTVLVIGATFKHAIRLTVPDTEIRPRQKRPEPISQTRTADARMSQLDRDAIVAMVSGYLLPFPAYNPEPLTYGEVAKAISVDRGTIVKRVEHYRWRLIEAGVPGLEGEADARRSLAEWVLSTRLVTTADLDEHRRRFGHHR